MSDIKLKGRFIISGNTPPVIYTVNAGVDKHIYLPNNQITLTGQSNDTYLWTVVEGANTPTLINSTGQTVTVQDMIEGLYKFKLTNHDVFDDVNVLVSPEVISISTEEFNGNFPSWRNFREEYNIVGSTVDVTSQLQDAINKIRTVGYSNVLYISSNNGNVTTYEISSTITRIGGESIRIICEDPFKVIFKWTGADNGVMFDFDGVAYSRIFHRCTMTTDKSGVTFVQQGFNGQYNVEDRKFDTGNSYEEIVFINPKYAIYGGFRNNGFAETLIDNCRIYNASRIGIATGNFNALDTWIRRCYFENNYIGIGNNDGSGNFHAFGCIFKDNDYDMVAQATEQFSARECFSINSRGFLLSGFNPPNTSVYVFQKNRVIDTNDSQTLNSNQWSCIYVGNNGAVLGTDNIFNLTPDPATGYPYEGAFRYGGFSIAHTTIGEKTNRDNGYVQNMMAQDQVNYSSNYDLSIGDVIDKTIPSLHAFRPTVIRTVHEMTPQHSQAYVQNLINTIGTDPNKQILHLAANEYPNLNVLTIPANSTIQIIGDGLEDTKLNCTIIIQGPSKPTLKDFKLVGNQSGLITNDTNQLGSRIFFSQLEFFFNSTKGVEVINSNIDTYFTNSGWGSGNATGVKVMGGTGITTLIGCQGRQTTKQFEVENGKLHVATYWAEGDVFYRYLHVKGNSEVTLNGGRLHVTEYNNDGTILVEGGNNKLTVAGYNLENVVKVIDNTSKVLLTDNLLSAPYLINTGTSDARAIHTIYRDGQSSGSLGPNIGVKDETFITTMLEQARTLSLPQLADTPSNTTDIRVFSVRIENSFNGLQINN